MLKQIEKVEIVFGQYENGGWYAYSSSVPWLAAEGRDYDELTRQMSEIAPTLLGNATCLKIPFELVWVQERSWE